MSRFDILCRCNRFRSLSLLSPTVLRYGIFNCLIPDAALLTSVDPMGEVLASVDPMGEVAPRINSLGIFGKNVSISKI